MGPNNVIGIYIIVNGSSIKSELLVMVPNVAIFTYVVVNENVLVVIYSSFLV